MRSRKFLWFLSLALCLSPVWGRAEKDDTSAKILALFFPYREGPLRVDGIAPGLKIDKTNAQVAAGVMPPELLDRLAA